MNDWIEDLAARDPIGIGRNLLVVVLAAALALAVHRAVLWALCRVTRRSETRADNLLVDRLYQPLRWITVALALTAVRPSLLFTDRGAMLWERGAGLVMAALVGWIALALLGFARDWVDLRADISIADNLEARRRRTRIAIVHRIGAVIIVVLTVCLMLMTIPAVRNIGITMLASAGLIGLAVGAAAQPALKNLIAGIQMAITEPIRIDDVVIIDGEWGRIEEIRLTYVVVRIWDERRLVVPVSRFLDESFENWTRRSSELLGTAFLHVDPTAEVPRIRAKLEQVVAAEPLWDGRVCVLQVTGTAPDHLELRALVSAADAGAAYDLRCNVREAMSAFLADEMPEALVRHRLAPGAETRAPTATP